MFDAHHFGSWTVVLVGAAAFAGLFGLAALMAELVLDGSFRMTRGVVGFAIAAFVGFVAVAWFVRMRAGTRGEL